MTTGHPLPAPPVQPHPVPAAPAEIVPEQAMVPAPAPEPKDTSIAPDSPAARLPVELDVCVPVREFRVRNLLNLDSGVIIESQWGHGDDVPLTSGDVQLAWSEFEVVDTQLAVRVTRLA